MVNQALHNNPDYQAQSIITRNQPTKHWACPVYYSNTGAKQSIDLLLKGEDKITWTGSLTNELGRITQGIGKYRPIDKKIEGKNTIKIPTNVKITYANFVCDIRPPKK